MNNSTQGSILNGVNLLKAGGTGSFGNHVVAKLNDLSPRQITIFSRDEKKQFDMRNKFSNNLVLKFIIGDARNPDRVDAVMQGVDYVFHAAALKHMPTCEFVPFEAVQTNVMGANNVLNTAEKHGAKKADEYEDFHRIRNLNQIDYNKYPADGSETSMPEPDYTSQNTRRLDLEETKEPVQSPEGIRAILA